MLTNNSQGFYTKTQSGPSPIILPMPFEEYVSLRNIVAKPQLWQFSHRGTLGFSLYRASEKDTTGLDGAQDRLFELCPGKKLRYRVSVPGYEPFDFHKYASSARKGARTPNIRAKVITQVADVVARFIKKAVRTKADENQLQFGPGHLELGDLYLLELRCTGSTVQIILGYTEKATSAPAAPQAVQPIETNSVAALDCLEGRTTGLGILSIRPSSPRSSLLLIQPVPGSSKHGGVPGASFLLPDLASMSATMSGSGFNFGFAENGPYAAPPILQYHPLAYLPPPYVQPLCTDDTAEGVHVTFDAHDQYDTPI